MLSCVTCLLCAEADNCGTEFSRTIYNNDDMETFDSLEQPLCDYNESMDALPELWESESFESVS